MDKATWTVEIYVFNIAWEEFMKFYLRTGCLLLLGMLASIASASNCSYDLREGAVFHNLNRTPTDGNGTPQENQLVVFLRHADGTLSSDIETHLVNSGGYGNQPGIVTSGQNAVIHTGSGDDQYVFMINAGFNPVPNKYGKLDRSGSVSAFKVDKCRVTLTDVQSTRGQEPRAVTRDTRKYGYRKRDIVYVVNAGSGEVQFNGCPGLPVGFQAPTGITCGERPEVEEFDATSIIGYKFWNGKLRYIRGSFRRTADPDGDPAQISLINEGRQVIVAQRSTFFALGDGTEDDNVEVFNLDRWGRPGKPIVSETTGNDNFGFSVFPRSGKDFNDCVIMSHGSFQQRDQGGTSVFTIDSSGKTDTIIPNKPDGGSDTCWTAISSRTNTVYAHAFFDSEISIRGFNPETCNITDGGPPILPGDNQFTGALLNIRHRVTSSGVFMGGAPRGDDIRLATDQSDFLFEAGGLDMSLSKVGHEEYLYALWTPVPFSIGQDGDGNFLYPPDSAQIAVFRVIQDCNDTLGDSIYADGCRVGDLELVTRVTGIPGSGFGMAAN